MHDLELTADGGIVLSGKLTGGSLGFNQVLSTATSAIFFARFDATGEPTWSTLIDRQDEVSSVAAAPQGHVFLGLAIKGEPAAFGGVTLTPKGTDPTKADLVIARLDGTTLTWVKQYGDESNQDDMSLTADDDGGVLATGELGGTLAFGGGVSISDKATNDAFIAKLDGAGTGVWARVRTDGSGIWGTEAAPGVLVVGAHKSALTLDRCAVPGNATPHHFLFWLWRCPARC